jgi:hypothetical protein
VSTHNRPALFLQQCEATINVSTARTVTARYGASCINRPVCDVSPAACATDALLHVAQVYLSIVARTCNRSCCARSSAWLCESTRAAVACSTCSSSSCCCCSAALLARPPRGLATCCARLLLIDSCSRSRAAETSCSQPSMCSTATSPFVAAANRRSTRDGDDAGERTASRTAACEDRCSVHCGHTCTKRETKQHDLDRSDSRGPKTYV